MGNQDSTPSTSSHAQQQAAAVPSPFGRDTVLEKLSHRDLSLVRLVAHAALLWASGLGWILVASTSDGDRTMRLALGTALIAVAVAVTAGMLWNGRRDRQALTDRLSAERMALLEQPPQPYAGSPAGTADPLAGRYRMGVRGLLWGAGSTAALLAGLLGFGVGLLGVRQAQGSSAVFGFGLCVTMSTAGAAGLTKVIRRYRLSIHDYTFLETRYRDFELIAGVARFGVTLTEADLAEVRATGLGRLRHLERLAKAPTDGTPEKVQFYRKNPNYWVLTVLAGFFLAGGMLLAQIGSPMRRTELAEAGIVWVLVVLLVGLLTGLRHMHGKRAVAAAAGRVTAPAGARCAVPARVDGDAGLLVHDSGRLTLLTASGTGTPFQVPLQRVRAVFELNRNQTMWGNPGVYLLLDDGGWIDVRTPQVARLLEACEESGPRVLRRTIQDENIIEAIQGIIRNLS
ncbi:hypothetical protein ACWEQ7_05710 [Streptomyces sp. NPDC004069]